MSAQFHIACHSLMDEYPFKEAKNLESLAGMLVPQCSQSQIREFYLNGLLPDFIGTDMDYWMLIRRYYALKEQYKGDTGR
jgi:hypothetical protein